MIDRELLELAAKAAFPNGAEGEVFAHWNAARKAMEKNT